MLAYVQSNTQLTENVFQLTVSVEKGAFDALRPGQFAMVTCGDGHYLRRPISVNNLDVFLFNDSLTLVIEKKGGGTEYLSQLKERDAVEISGPLGGGHFHWLPGEKILLIGGGIGTAPLLYAARTIKYSGADPIAILGFRSAEQVMLEAAFAERCDRNVVVTTDDGSYGRTGNVVDLADIFANEPLTVYDRILACGPKPMLRAVAEFANKWDIPCQVSLEEHMGCGVGACKGCPAYFVNDTVPKRICKDGPVFDAKEVNWDV